MISALSLAVLTALAPSPGTPAEEAPPAPSWYAIERGEGRAELRVPLEEKLVFDAHVHLAIMGGRVGKVTMRSGVEEYRPPILAAGGNDKPTPIGASTAGAGDPPRTASLRIHASGEYAWYEMDAIIETRILPQDWPRFSYRYTHDGSERRRREVLLGLHEDAWTASYRKDTRKNAPKGTRIWRDPKTRDVPQETLDLLSAVYLSRTLVQDDLDELRFPVIDKLNLWDMRLSRGTEARMETECGTFDVVQIVLEPSPMEGEDVDEDKAERFEGLFGLHGSIQLWVERTTGVPVRIQGELPVGPLDLEIDIVLRSYEGTPAAFAPR